MDIWDLPALDPIEQARTEFRRLGLYIFETFEEYMENREEEQE